MSVELQIEVARFPKVKVFASDPPRICDIFAWKKQGPWQSKSGGNLWLVFQFNLVDLLDSFFRYDPEELGVFSQDIRGIREYEVAEVPLGTRGGLHFHRVRQSLVQVQQGEIEFELEDVFGGRCSFILTPNDLMLIPPFMFLTYQARVSDSRFTMLVNTTYLVDCTDTYDLDQFRALQMHYR